MPAVTVPDLLVLPRVQRPATALAPQRAVVSVTTAPTGFEGEGFPVHRAFAGVDLRLLDPFIHMDQMGAVEYAPGEPKGTPWHPHRGFETVTYMIDGEMAHRDSQGGGGLITNGDTQWMTAGSGLLHIETPPEALVVSGGLFHGIQLWVNLPKTLKMADPRYQDIRAGEVSLATTGDGGALLRVIAGELAGAEGPLPGPGQLVGLKQFARANGEAVVGCRRLCQREDLQQPRDEGRGETHQADRKDEAEDEDRGVVARRPRHRQHIVERHRDVGNDDLPRRLGK